MRDVEASHLSRPLELAVVGRAFFNACKDCARLGRPCFTFVTTGGWEEDGCPKGEFRLLPLHKVDVGVPATTGFELRYWVNDMIEVEETDECGSGEDFVDDD